jgi:hypothetical protein
MLSALYVLASGAQLMLVADRIPQLNYEPSCRAAIHATTGTKSNRNENACLSDEKAAKTKLHQEWGQFSAKQKGHCIRLLNAGGSPSYVELLTCVEMGKAVKQLDAQRNTKAKTEPAETTGQAPIESGVSRPLR